MERRKTVTRFRRSIRLLRQRCRCELENTAAIESNWSRIAIVPVNGWRGPRLCSPTATRKNAYQYSGGVECHLIPKRRPIPTGWSSPSSGLTASCGELTVTARVNGRHYPKDAILNLLFALQTADLQYKFSALFRVYFYDAIIMNVNSKSPMRLHGGFFTTIQLSTLQRMKTCAMSSWTGLKKRI